MKFRRCITSMRAEVASLRLGLMAGVGTRLALCAFVFALAAAVAEAQAQAAADVDECAAGTDTCGATHLCGDTETGFVCGQECPNGFVHGSNRTECAESCYPGTHLVNADHECVRGIQPFAAEHGESMCMQAGWTVTLHSRNEGSIREKECLIPYRNATTQTDESGCWAHPSGLEINRFYGYTTASRYCWELSDLHGLPSFADHDEGDRYVHTCPDGKEPSADLKSCVCPSGYTTNADGDCADIDECAADANICGAGGVCANTIGGHACACNAGYAQESETLASQCGDIDECAAGTHTCGEHNRCDNTAGGFTCVSVDECAAGTDACGESNLCGDIEDGFICGQECPNGFVHGSDRTECAETCDFSTHMINADNECVPTQKTGADKARRQCAIAGWRWNFINSTLTAGLQLGIECAIPYRNAATQADENGCWISEFSLEKAQSEGGATATQHCHNLFDLDGIPSFADHNEGDMYFYNCPDGKEPSADLKSCVCSSGHVENRAGMCVDIDECASDANICGQNAMCENTVGGHACHCKTGYSPVSDTLTSQCGDIDECAARTDACGENDLCGNTVGGFACTPCPDGFDPDSDRAECEPAEPAPLACPPGEYPDGGACVRFPWTTVFNLCNSAGWQRNSHILYDECVVPYWDATTQTEHESCFLTKEDATDEELRNAGATATADCWEFFTNDQLVPQSANHNEGDRYVYNCPAPKIPSADLKSCVCAAGYADIGGTCVDINECGDGTHACGETGVCANTTGSYTCSCASGYASESADTLECSDVDECAAGTDTCGANVLCANIAGGFVCGNECPSGFTPGADRTECVDAAPCPAGETKDEAGMCVCPDGQTRVGGQCQITRNDVTQSCRDAGWTVADVIWTFISSPQVIGGECQIPYRNATTRTDERGCLIWRANGINILPEHTTATRFCRDLFADDGIPLTANHNEGDRYVHTCPGAKTPSADLKSCACPAGWTEDDSGICGVDIDECATGAHSCGEHENARCANTNGGHICACDAGYAPAGDGWTLLNPQCADVDECAAETDSCGANSLCENTIGGFVCGNVCADGLVPNAERTECADPNACPDYHIRDSASGQCVCNTAEARISDGVCVPTGAAAACQTAGWDVETHEFLGNMLNVECVIPLRDETAQVDESGCLFLPPEDVALAEYQTDASETCHDLFGEDIPMTLNHNEGDRYVHSCPGVKTPGADYKSCVCPSEYMENDEGVCVDFDECAAGSHSCEENASCVNTIGGHACSCSTGYAPGDDWTFLSPNCGDVDECAAGTDDCGANTLCGNTVGGFLCGKTCPEGLHPNADRTECAPCPPGQTQDETGACMCDPETRFINTGFGGACHLTSPAATNMCRNAGWLAMTVFHNSAALGAVCLIPYRDETAQVDETGCSLWRNRRHSDAARWNDYQTTSQRCRDLFDAHPVPLSLNYNEGDRYVHSCPAPKTPSDDLKSCDCPAGYAEDGGGNCVDINECETDARACGANAACVNTLGSHACSCSAGYAPAGDSLQNPQCADIDECAAGTHSCGEHESAFCANTVGDYECSCYVNHSPLNPNDPKNPGCLGSFDLTLSHSVNGTLYAEYGGITIGGGVNHVPQGATISLTARPDAGFYLLEWGGDCADRRSAAPSERGLSQTCKLTVDATRGVGATFERAWQATFDSRPANGTLSAQVKGGKILQSGDIARRGTTVIFTAEPGSGFYLLKWGGNCAGRSAAEPHERGLSKTCELTLSAETTVGATFERAWQTTFDSEPVNGTLSAQVKDGITLRSGDIVRGGTTVIYTAQPDPGFYLLKWGGACGGEPAAEPHERGLPQTCGITLNAETTVAAAFERAWETTFNQPPNGTLSAEVKDRETLQSGDIVRRGTTIIYTALPDPGFYLLEWTGDCEDEPAAEPSERGLFKECELIADEARRIGAVFARAGEIAFNARPPNGTLSAQVQDGETLRPGDVVREGTTVVFTAQPDAGFYLLEWTGDCEDEPDAEPYERGLSKTCELTATPSTRAGATFKRAWQTTFDPQPGNGALSARIKDGETLQSGDIAPEGTTVTFTAEPDPGFYLLEWGGHCATHSPAEPSERGLLQTCELTLNVETTVAATFERAWETTFSQPDNGALSAEIKGGETLQSGGIVREGTTIIYTALPDSGYYLLEWTGHCENFPAAEPSERGLSKECKLIADGARAVGAVFARAGEIAFNAQPPNGTLSAQVKNGETLRPGDVVREGTTVVFTARPDAGHYLLEWTDDCEDEPDAEPHERGLPKKCALAATPSTQVGATFERAWQTTFDPQPPNGALSAENTDGETLQSGDIAPEGTTVIFTARPDAGFYLLEWGGACRDEPDAEPHERGLPQTCGITLNAETTVAATFERAWETTFSQPDNGTLSAEIKGGKTLRSGDIVRRGTTIIYTAQPDSEFYLLEWTDHCRNIPAAEPSEHGLSKKCELIADEERQVGAVFARIGGIAFNAQPSNGMLSAQIQDGDALQPGDVVREGTTVVFTAQPDAGYYLLEWTGDCEDEPDAEPYERGLSKTCELTATPSTQVGATFKRAWQTTFDPQPDNGALSAQIKDGETLQSGDIAPEGTTIIFTAQPDTGFYLSEWGGRCAKRARAEPHERGRPKTCEITLNVETTVSATFERAWEATFNQPPNGTLSAENADGETLLSGDIASEGTTVIFTAQPDAGFYLLEWGGHCAGQPTAEPSGRGLPKTCELTLNAETTVAATFERAWRTTFDSRPANGALSAQVKDGETLQSGDIAPEETIVIFTARPDAGFYLLEWGGHCAGQPAAEPSERGLSQTCELTLSAETTVAATFERAWQAIFDSQPSDGALSAQIKDGETLQSGDSAPEGTTIIFTAQPDLGFYLLKWGGHCETRTPAEPHERGRPQTCEITLNAETTVAATFERAWETTFGQPDNGTLSAQIKNDDKGELQSGGAAREGTTIVITAQPDSEFYLLKWTGDCVGQTVGSPARPGAAKTCELTADSEKQFGAVFERASETMFNPAPHGGRLSARIKDGAELAPGEKTRPGTTIIFTAQPNPRYYLLKWTGNCKGELVADPNERGQSKECEVVASGDPQVGAVFKLAWLVNLDPPTDRPQNGTLSARVMGGKILRSGDAVPDGATVVFTATPDPGFYMARWQQDRAGRCDKASKNPERNPEPQICRAVVAGDSFGITPPAPMFNSSCLPIRNALGDENNPGKCVCADPAHLIFGEGENRFCAPPTICPTGYSNDKGDCIKHDANPPLPDYANSPEGCEKVFGGQRRQQQAVCLGIDIQGTFCLVGSRDAFPCRGLFKHVRRCNGFNRPALNPFICGAECPGGVNTARGRYCGKETADENPDQ